SIAMRTASWCTAGWPSSTSRPPGTSRCPTRTRPSTWSSTARSTTTGRCEPSSKAAATSSAARPIRRTWATCMRRWGGGLRAECRSVGASPDGSRTLADAVEAASVALLDAVACQSVADVPVAGLLSGGIDSSLVVAARERATGGPTTTFNVRFPDRSHDETARARAVATQYGTRHVTVDLSDGALQTEAILDLLRHFDQPFADTTPIPTHWIPRAVRDQGII